MGSPAVADWVAQVAFLSLVALGWSELGPRKIAMFLALWIVGLVARPFVPFGPGLFTPYVAVLDIALVVSIFKGDVRLG